MQMQNYIYLTLRGITSKNIQVIDFTTLHILYASWCPIT